AISIANDVPWRLLPTVRLGQLTADPIGTRACGHTQPQKLAAGMLQDQKSIQQPKRDRPDSAQNHRTQHLHTNAQKGLPDLAKRRKHQPVNVAKRQSLWGFAPQHVELMSKDEDLGLQRSSRPEESDQGAPDQPAKIAHRQRVSADSRSRSAVLGLR